MQLGPLSEARLRQLAVEIRDGAFSSETDWVEWKRELDFSSVGGRFPLPKNILGIANRMPEVARRNCGGYGYILIGVESGTMLGITPVDVAQLEDWIAPYIGATGPSWTPRYLQVEGTTILAVEVTPPSPGDSIHTLRREFDNFNAGTIFVRKNGKTERASPEDIKNLEERTRGSRLELDLRLVGPEQMSWFDGDSVTRAITRRIESSRESQLARARKFNSAGEPTSAFGHVERLAAIATYGSDNRSLEEYRDEVETWREKMSGVAMQHWLDTYLIAGHGVCALQLANLTDQNFADVEVRLLIRGARVEDEIPAEAIALPTKPKPFGRGIGLLDIARINLDYPALGFSFPTAYEPPDIYAIQRDGTAEIVWKVGHLRPEATFESAEFGVTVDAPRDADHLEMAWSATSTNVSGIAKGTVEVLLSGRPILLDDIGHELGS